MREHLRARDQCRWHCTPHCPMMSGHASSDTVQEAPASGSCCQVSAARPTPASMPQVPTNSSTSMPMTGRVRVTAAGAASAAVSIQDSPPRFQPDDVTIRAGGTVTWTHAGTQPHTVTDSSAGGQQQVAINGRAYVGNTPTIVAESGKRVRWYVFNLDLGEQWHNFHTHGQRFRVGNDGRSLDPAESFVVDTLVPPVILLPDCDHHSHYDGSHDHHIGCKCYSSQKLANIRQLVLEIC